MRLRISAMFATTLQLTGAAPCQAEAGHSILDRHATAVGGRSAMAAAGDFILDGTIRSDGEPLHLRTYVRRNPFALRQEVSSAPESPTLVRITDGRYAWQLGENGTAAPLPAAFARTMIEGAFLDGLRYLDEQSTVPGEIDGFVTLPGIAGLPPDLGASGRLRDVQFAPAGATVHLLFDETTANLRAFVSSSTQPPGEVRLGNWQTIDGIRWPMVRWEFVSGSAATVTIETVRCSQKLDSALFAGCPAPIVPPLMRVADLWLLPDVVPGAAQFAVPHVGIGNGLEVVALFDTGAASLFLATAAADRARLQVLGDARARGLHGTATASHRWLDELRIGTFVDRQLRVLAAQLPPIAALAACEQPAMILGGPIAIDRSPVLDLQGGSLWLRGEPVTPLGTDEADHPSLLRVPFRRLAGSALPVLDVGLGEQTIEAVLDTGQAALLRLTTTGLARAGLPIDAASWKARGAVPMSMEGAGGQSAEDLLVRLPSIRVASVRWEEPWVMLALGDGAPPYEAALGGGALWHFARVGIDAQRSVLELEPRPTVQVEGSDWVVPQKCAFAGIIPVPAPIGAEGPDAMPWVHEVIPGSIAAKAGVVAGDRIRSIDGRNCEGQAPRTFSHRLWLGTSPVVLEVVRADGSLATIPLRASGTER